MKTLLDYFDAKVLSGKPKNGFTTFPIFLLLVNLKIGGNSISVSLEDVQVNALVTRRDFLLSVPQFPLWLLSKMPSLPAYGLFANIRRREIVPSFFCRANTDLH